MKTREQLDIKKIGIRAVELFCYLFLFLSAMSFMMVIFITSIITFTLSMDYFIRNGNSEYAKSVLRYFELIKLGTWGFFLAQFWTSHRMASEYSDALSKFLQDKLGVKFE